MGKRNITQVAPQGWGVIEKSRGKQQGFVTKVIAENGQMLMTSKQVLNDKPTALQNLFQTRNALMGYEDTRGFVFVDKTVQPHQVCVAFYSGSMDILEDVTLSKPKKKKSSI